MNDLRLWEQVLLVAVGIPLALMMLYMVVRVIAAACVNSWWESKMKYTNKLLDVFKDNPPSGQEGKHAKR